MTDALERMARGLVVAGAVVMIRRPVDVCRADGHREGNFFEQYEDGAPWHCGYCGDEVPTPQYPHFVISKTSDFHSYVAEIG